MDRKIDKNAEADLMKQVKTLVIDGKFAEALDVVNQMDVGRVKTAPNLCLIGEVYMKERMYDEAEAVFLRAYDKSPTNRRILNLLTSLYIEMNDFSEAEYYYKEFIGVASRDLHRYILRYRLDKAKGERTSVLIDTLERLKDYEYIEEWAYELAALYHSSGDDKKCIHECDEIVLWFGQGEFVNKAIRLKCEVTGEPVPEFLIGDENTEERAGEQIENENQFADVGIDVDLIDKVLNGEPIEPEVKEAQADAADSASDSIDADLKPEEPEAEAHTAGQKPGAVTDTGMLFEALSSGKAQEFWVREDDGEEEDELISGIISDEPETSEASGDFEDAIDEDDEEDEIIVEPIEGGAGDDLFEALLNEDEDLFETGSVSLSEVDLDEDEDEDESSEVTKDSDTGKAEPDDAEEAVVGDDGLIMDEDDIVEERVWTAEDKTFIKGLFESSPKTQNDVFSTVPNIDYVKEQLSRTFTKFEEGTTEKFDILAPYDINFVVLSTDKSLKSQIALGIAKALNTYGICDKNKIVRAKAEELNRRDFSMIFEKLKGGCLIIEKADLLSDASVAIIEAQVNGENQQTAIVFESFHDEMMQFWKKHQALRAKFLNVINVSKYNEMELVTLAKGYIEQKGYEMDPEVALLMRDYFKKCLDSDHVVNYEDVMGIVDIAVSNLEKRNVKNLFMTVLDNKYEEARMFKLIPEDFKHLDV